jgi:malate synthase
LWQWLRFEAPLDDGRGFTRTLFERLFEEEVGALADVANIDAAATLFRQLVVAGGFEEFLTLPAYRYLQ